VTQVREVALIVWRYWSELYHCGEFFLGVVLATLVCWCCWRLPRFRLRRPS
jgi:hypothetical protein